MIKKTLILWLLSSNLYADTIKVNLVRVEGSNSVTSAEARSIWRNFKKEAKTLTGLTFKRVSYRTISAPYPTLNYLATRVDSFEAMESEVITNKKGELTYFIMPPLIEGDKLFKSGRAHKRCGLDAYKTYGVGWHKQDDVYRSTGLMLHEVFHMLNASHVSDDSLMSDYLPAGTNRHLSAITKLQIKDCTE
jgi:hypothetical protein